jgi:ribosomal-protein-alanine N-acetyltransferase
MQLGDVEQVHQIDQLSFSLPWPESAYRYELTQNVASASWVAEVVRPDGMTRVIGMVVVWLILDEVHIATIAVHPEYRRQGISQQLLAVVLRAALQRGARLATLEVRAGNQAALALYRRFKFEVVGRRPHYYHDNHEDALIMTADLSQSSAYLEWLDSAQPVSSNNRSAD